ncbi:Hypothetical predicted protein [Paramuricea clavata]|uniref:Uncharacterized protein n=1 Tax=Paramuricea clavata TaxID=317549 RepID=A0A6S7FXR9_PARCT|nr:Hypothetical predicted protein [Paramuricea clavata]
MAKALELGLEEDHPLVLKSISKKELSLHCRRQTRGTEKTATLLLHLLKTFDGEQGRDTRYYLTCVALCTWLNVIGVFPSALEQVSTRWNDHQKNLEKRILTREILPSPPNTTLTPLPVSHRLSRCIFEWDQENPGLNAAKWANRAELSASGVRNPSTAAVRSAVSKKELAGHSRRRRGHIPCIQDPPEIPLYTVIGQTKEEWKTLPIYRCARGGSYLAGKLPPSSSKVYSRNISKWSVISSLPDRLIGAMEPAALVRQYGSFNLKQEDEEAAVDALGIPGWDKVGKLASSLLALDGHVTDKQAAEITQLYLNLRSTMDNSSYPVLRTKTKCFLSSSSGPAQWPDYNRYNKREKKMERDVLRQGIRLPLPEQASQDPLPSATPLPSSLAIPENTTGKVKGFVRRPVPLPQSPPVLPQPHPISSQSTVSQSPSQQNRSQFYYQKRKAEMEASGISVRKYQRSSKPVTCDKCKQSRDPATHRQYFENWYC